MSLFLDPWDEVCLFLGSGFGNDLLPAPRPPRAPAALPEQARPRFLPSISLSLESKDSKKRLLREEPFSSFSSVLGRTRRNPSWRNIARVQAPRSRTKLAFEIAAVMIIRRLFCSKKRLATRTCIAFEINNLWTLVAVHSGSVQKHPNPCGESVLTLRALVQIGPLHVLEKGFGRNWDHHIALSCRLPRGTVTPEKKND